MSNEGRRHNNSFERDIQSIFDLLEFQNAAASEAGYTLETFGSMVQNMIKRELHWKANNAPEIKHFADEEIQRIKLLREGTTQEQEAFWIARMSWNQLTSELDDINLRVENQRLKHREIERKWLVIFGELEVEQTELQVKCKDLETRLLLMEVNPQMNLDELNSAVESEEKKRCKELNDLKAWTMIAGLLEKPDTGGKPMDNQMFEDYNKECKRLSRKIWFLTYPDTLCHHSAYNELTDNQKHELQKFLMAALEPDNDELGVPKGFVNADMRSPGGLRRVLDRIYEILDNAGIEIEVDTFIKGETLKEQLAWLKQENKRLENMIEVARTRLKVMVDDEELKRKQDTLRFPEKHEAIKKDFMAELEKYRQMAGEMEA